MNRFFDIPTGDLSGYLSTQKIMDNRYLLSNKNVTIFVDSVKPRILGILTHGKFGTLQYLTYNPDGWRYDGGLWTIVPFYLKGGKSFYPFQTKHLIYKEFKANEEKYYGLSNVIAFNGLTCYGPDGEKDAEMDFAVELLGDDVKIKVKYPEGVEKGGIYSTWYPLYSHYKTGLGCENLIEYYNDGHMANYYPYFDREIGKNIIFRDRFNRMPALEISTDTGICRLTSGTDKERGNAYFLDLTCSTDNQYQAMTIGIRENDMVIHGSPIRLTGNQEFTLFSRESPEVLVDKAAAEVKKVSDTGYTVKCDLKHGMHEIRVKTDNSLMVRNFFAIENLKDKVVPMAKAVLQMPWKEGPIEGLFPYMYQLDPIAPLPRAGYSFCAHSLRVFPIIAAASMVSGDAAFINQGFRLIKKTLEKCNVLDDGSIVVPLSFDFKGKPGYLNSSRPSDQGLMVRALRVLALGFRHFKMDREYSECIDLAFRIVKTMSRMQDKDGGFYPRFDYYTLKPNIESKESKGTVNNWAIQLWELSQLLEDICPEKADFCRDICIKHIDFLLFKYKPSLLSICGGGEDMPNFRDALSTAASYLTIKYLDSMDEKYYEYAKQALLSSSLTNSIPIDQPTCFWAATMWHGGCFVNQPDGLPAKGGMTDLTQMDAALFVYDKLGYKLGLELPQLGYATRMADMIRDSGAVMDFTILVPNYTYIKNDMAHPLNFGGVGVYALHQAIEMSKEIKIQT